MRTLRFECPSWLLAVSDDDNERVFYRMERSNDGYTRRYVSARYGRTPKLIRPGTPIERVFDETKDVDQVEIRELIGGFYGENDFDGVPDQFGYFKGEFFRIYLPEESVFNQPCAVHAV